MDEWVTKPNARMFKFKKQARYAARRFNKLGCFAIQQALPHLLASPNYILPRQA